MSVLDELHAVVSELEAEGHAVATRLRDVATRIKNDVEGLIGISRTELDDLAEALVKKFAPQTFAEFKTVLGELVDVIEPALTSGKTNIEEVFADVLAALRAAL